MRFRSPVACDARQPGQTSSRFYPGKRVRIEVIPPGSREADLPAARWSGFGRRCSSRSSDQARLGLAFGSPAWLKKLEQLVSSDRLWLREAFHDNLQPTP